MNVILDTNFLIAFLDKKSTLHKKADKLVDQLVDENVLVHTPRIILAEVLIGEKKHFDEVFRLIDQLTIEYLEINNKVIQALKDIPNKQKLKIIDSLILAMCQINKCHLVTYDKNLARIASKMSLNYFD